MRLADAPRLHVTEVVGDAWVARVPDHRWVGENWTCWLVLDDGRMACAKFVGLDRAAGVSRVRPDDPERLAWLRPGKDCSFFGGYWGERVELVLGGPHRWTETVFRPSDAVESPAPPGGRWLTALVGDVPLGSRVIPDGWDHEHCAICWAKIGNYGAPSGYVSEEQDWICIACHQRYVVPRSIDFIQPGQ